MRAQDAGRCCVCTSFYTQHVVVIQVTRIRNLWRGDRHMATASEDIINTIKLNVKFRDNGSVFISSDDMEGLWLWGDDPEKVFQHIVPTIKALYKANQHMEVDVKPIRQSPEGRLSDIQSEPRLFEIYRQAERRGSNKHGSQTISR